MQLIPKDLGDLLSREINIDNEKDIELLVTDAVESIIQSEEYYPAEKADKLIWALAFFDKEKAYWESQVELAVRYKDGMEKIKQSFMAYVRMIMVDEEDWYGTREKIIAKDYVRRSIDESLLSDEEYSYNIEGLTLEQYNKVVNFLGEIPKSSKKAYTVTKLPEDHLAIKVNSRRLIQVRPLSQKDLKASK